MNDRTTAPRNNASPTSHVPGSGPQHRSRVPAWVVAIVCLQSVTLLAVFAGQPSATEAVAAEIYQSRSRDNRPQQSTLPNAAAQRREQIVALNKINQQLEITNERLGQIGKLLESGELKVQTGGAVE